MSVFLIRFNSLDRRPDIVRQSGITDSDPGVARAGVVEPAHPPLVAAEERETRLQVVGDVAIEAPLAAEGAGVFRGGDFDSWDLEVRGGALGPVRLRVLIEDYRTNGQLVRVRAWPRWPMPFILPCCA